MVIRWILIAGLAAAGVALAPCRDAAAQSQVAQERPCGPDSLPDWMRRLLPQGYHGADFRSSCRGHDSCYMQPGVSQKHCDQLFYQNMLKACRCSRRPCGCRRRATVMYLLVRLTGRGAYRESQQMAAEQIAARQTVVQQAVAEQAVAEQASPIRPPVAEQAPASNGPRIMASRGGRYGRRY